ncbi:hypothetical protein LPJ75_003737, partial [Coemansia sp. RSA 2598]
MRKYTLCVPGLGTASSDSITELGIDGLGFSQLVERASRNRVRQQSSTSDIEQRDACNTVWLDILLPCQGDINALAAIFDISTAIIHRLSGNIGDEAANPECKVADTSLYLCWAESTASTNGAAKYFSYGTIGDGDNGGDFKDGVATESSTTTAVTVAASETDKKAKGPATVAAPTDGSLDSVRENAARASWIGGYFPVPPWMQPSATQVLSRLDLRKRPKKNEAGEAIVASQSAIESVRRQNMKHILSMLSKPAVANKERTWRVLKRWGPGHEQWWQE